MSSETPFVVRVDDLSRARARRTSTGEPLGWVRSVLDGERSPSLRVDVVELPPGERVAPPHGHSARDEVFFVLAGRVVPVIDGHALPAIAAGAILVAPRGSAPCTVRNESHEPATLLQISAGEDDDQVRYAPE